MLQCINQHKYKASPSVSEIWKASPLGKSVCKFAYALVANLFDFPSGEAFNKFLQVGLSLYIMLPVATKDILAKVRADYGKICMKHPAKQSHKICVFERSEYANRLCKLWCFTNLGSGGANFAICFCSINIKLRPPIATSGKHVHYTSTFSSKLLVSHIFF